jgi:hypothetical protein
LIDSTGVRGVVWRSLLYEGERRFEVERKLCEFIPSLGIVIPLARATIARDLCQVGLQVFTLVKGEGLRTWRLGWLSEATADDHAACFAVQTINIESRG